MTLSRSIYARRWWLGFIGAQNVTKVTRQRQLSALRKLAQMPYILAPTDDNRRIVEALKVVKAPTGGFCRGVGAGR